MSVNSADLLQIIIALAGGGFLASIIQGLWQRKKAGADYANVIATAATGLLTPLQDRIDSLLKEVKEKDKLIKEKDKLIERLQDELSSSRRLIRLLYQEIKAFKGGREPTTPLGDSQDSP